MYWKKNTKACTSKKIFVIQTWLVATLCATQKGRSVPIRAPKRCDMIVSAVILSWQCTTQPRLASTGPEAYPFSTFQYLRPWSEIACMALRWTKDSLEIYHSQREILWKLAQVSLNCGSVKVQDWSLLKKEFLFDFTREGKNLQKLATWKMEEYCTVSDEGLCSFLCLYATGSTRWTKTIFKQAHATRAHVGGKIWVTTWFFFAASTVKKKNSTANLQNCLIFVKCMCIVVFRFQLFTSFFFYNFNSFHDYIFSAIFRCVWKLIIDFFLSFNNMRVCSCLNLCQSKQRMLFNGPGCLLCHLTRILTCDGCFCRQRYNY